jgi:hypothetical protein
MNRVYKHDIQCLSRVLRNSVRTPALVGLMTCAVLIGVPGCYTEVINARGITADEHHPRRGKSSKPKIDQAIDDIFGIDDN